jgi:hypothetical protein
LGGAIGPSHLFNKYKRPYGIMMNIGIQRELKSGLVLTVDFVRNRGVHFNQTTDLNRIGAANTLDVGIATDAIIATNDAFGCGASAILRQSTAQLRRAKSVKDKMRFCPADAAL